MIAWRTQPADLSMLSLAQLTRPGLVAGLSFALALLAGQLTYHAVRSPRMAARAVEVAQRVIKEMQRAELVEIPRATHNVHSDNPMDFASALDAFLRRHV